MNQMIHRLDYISPIAPFVSADMCRNMAIVAETEML